MCFSALLLPLLSLCSIRKYSVSRVKSIQVLARACACPGRSFIFISSPIQLWGHHLIIINHPLRLALALLPNPRASSRRPVSPSGECQPFPALRSAVRLRWSNWKKPRLLWSVLTSNEEVPKIFHMQHSPTQSLVSLSHI